MSQAAGRILTGLLALFLLVAPLPFGGVLPEAEAALQATAFALLALAAFTTRRPRSLAPVLPLVLPLAALALWGFLQSQPWPEALVRHVSPEHARLHDQAAALVASDADDPDAAAPAPASTLSTAPAASRATALSFAATAAVLLAAAAACASRREGRRRRRILALTVLATALFEVLFGARGWSARATEIWGVAVPGSADRLRGTFVNSNHLALYLEIALPIAFAALWWSLRRARYQPTLDQRLLGVAPPALLWLALFVGLAFTGSRAGLAAAVAGVVAQGAAVAWTARRSRLLPVALAIGTLAVGLAAVLALGRQQGLGRFSTVGTQEVSRAARLEAYAATVGLWQRFPATGSGLGTFREAFPLVQPPGLAGHWIHAHSGPLELLATTGVPGGLLLLAGITALLLRLGAVLTKGRRSEDRAAALAALGAVAAVALHETLDFGLTLPGNGLTLAILLGAVAAARLRAADPVADPGTAGEVVPLRSPSRDEGDRSGQHPAADRRLELEDVDPLRHRQGEADDRRLLAFPRPGDRIAAHRRPVEP
jgi:O-antigen ligase